MLTKLGAQRGFGTNSSQKWSLVKSGVQFIGLNHYGTFKVKKFTTS
jgi:hypothetical protein